MNQTTAPTRIVTRVEYPDGTAQIIDTTGEENAAVPVVGPRRLDGTVVEFTVDWPTVSLTVVGDVFREPIVLVMDRADLTTCTAALAALDRAAPILAD